MTLAMRQRKAGPKARLADLVAAVEWPSAAYDRPGRRPADIWVYRKWRFECREAALGRRPAVVP